MLTVIVPCYRAKATVRRAIDSVLQAEGTRVIAIDDACPDGTGDFVSASYTHTARVDVVTNARNQGVGETRNIGIERAETEFITFLDADDYWTQAALGPQACESLAASNADAGIMPVVLDRGEGAAPTPYPDYELLAPYMGAEICYAQTPSLSVVQPCWALIYKRQFLRDNAIKFQRRRYEDHDFGLEVVLTAKSLLVLPMSPVVNYDKSRQDTLSSSVITSEGHRHFLDHVGRVRALMQRHPDLSFDFREERVSHYTYRLLWQLLEVGHLTDDMIGDSFSEIQAMRADNQVAALPERPAFQSQATRTLLDRHPYLTKALNRTLRDQKRFIHFVHLLRFVRQQPLGKARAMAKLGLRIASKPWR